MYVCVGVCGWASRWVSGPCLWADVVLHGFVHRDRPSVSLETPPINRPARNACTTPTVNQALQSNDGNFRRFNIQSVRRQDCAYPRAHTCFNKLDLPVYESKEELQAYLLLVIQTEITGFSID